MRKGWQRLIRACLCSTTEYSNVNNYNISEVCKILSDKTFLHVLKT